MSRRVGIVLLILWLLCGAGCSQNDATISAGPDFAELLPSHYQYLRTDRLETPWDDDQDGRPDRFWLVFYRFDVPADDSASGAPIGGIIYCLDNHCPADIDPYALTLANQDYLCECDCRGEMRSVFEDCPWVEHDNGRCDFLVVRDTCDGQVTRLAILHWNSTMHRFEEQDHFAGDAIQMDGDGLVMVSRRLDSDSPFGRSQLQLRTVFAPRLDAQQQSLYWGMWVTEHAFHSAVPEYVAASPYPEKLVLGYYAAFSTHADLAPFLCDRDAVSSAITHSGCVAPRDRVNHVWVVLEQVDERCSVGRDCTQWGPDSAWVRTMVQCQVGTDIGAAASVTWFLERPEERWCIDNWMLISDQTLPGTLPPAITAPAPALSTPAPFDISEWEGQEVPLEVLESIMGGNP